MRAGFDAGKVFSLASAGIATLLSLGGLAYSSGVLAQRVENSAQRIDMNSLRIDKLESVPERLARIEADLSYLRQAEERRQMRETRQ